MLVLSRKQGEGIVIDRNITVRFLGVRGQKICVGVEAPRDISILREELECRDQIEFVDDGELSLAPRD